MESVEVSHIKGALPDSLQKGNLRSLTLATVYDHRNDIFNTTRGRYIDVRNELVGSFLGGTDNYVKSTWNFRNFFPLNNKVVFGTNLQSGWVFPFLTTRTIPLSELFFAGGPNSLRGYAYQSVGPKNAAGVPIGGKFILMGNVEFRVRLYRIVGMAFFADAGNVFESPGLFRFNEILYDAGLGPRISTPLGVVRMDFAFKLNPDPDEERFQFYFALGQAF